MWCSPKSKSPSKTIRAIKRSKVPHFKPGVGPKIALHTARNFGVRISGFLFHSGSSPPVLFKGNLVGSCFGPSQPHRFISGLTSNLSVVRLELLSYFYLWFGGTVVFRPRCDPPQLAADCGAEYELEVINS